MALVRWLKDSDLFDQMEEMRREMGRMLSAASPWYGSTSGSLYRSGVYPPMNVYDKGEGFVVRAEIPGVDNKDIEVSVAGDTLTIQGERRDQEIPEGSSYHRRERGNGRFRRALTLPDQVDGSKVSASFKNGVLEILLPRSERARQRKIEIKS